jgi:hypothetical protein
VPLRHGEPPVKAPFLKGEDSLCVNDWWNRPANPIVDLKVPRDQVVAFGLYTVANGILKLSAQLYPLYPSETREVRLEVERDGRWVELTRRSVNDLGWSTAFRIEKWDHSRDQKYRLRHGERAIFDGLIRKSPVSNDEIKLAALSCNSNRDRGLRPEYSIAAPVTLESQVDSFPVACCVPSCDQTSSSIALPGMVRTPANPLRHRGVGPPRGRPAVRRPRLSRLVPTCRHHAPAALPPPDRVCHTCAGCSGMCRCSSATRIRFFPA